MVTFVLDTSTILVDFFFFKQKTAYEMRISDWSSDVCSSDLQDLDMRIGAALPFDQRDAFDIAPGREPATIGVRIGQRRRQRSEEHTSELQSLMRISYAVFCLKKKNKKTN